MCLSLAAQRPGLAVYDFRFVPPWRDNEFFTLPAFADSCRGEAYVLPNNWEFPREDILNCNFGKTGWRVPCTRVEGLLCVCSATPIPKEYPHGARIPVTVKFFGKSGRQLAETAVVLWADRWDQRAVRRPATEPSLAAQEHANLSAMVQPLDSDLFEGGKVTDSRAANLLPVKEPRSADRGRRSLDHTDQGRGARGAPDSL